MSKLDLNLPLEENKNETLPNPTDYAVTEADVIAVLVEAEESLSANQNLTTASDTDPQNIENDEDLAEQALAEQVMKKRNDRVENFVVDFSFDDIPDAEGMSPGSIDEATEQNESSAAETPTVIMDTVDDADQQPPKKAQTSTGCISRLIFALLILIISCALAAVISTFLLDVTGSTRNSREEDVVIPDGANTEQIATILKEHNLIDNIFYFRVYSRLTGADGKWQVGAFNLQADMGFPTLIETLQISPPRETVTVMFREGLTVEEMADLLEENAVCSREDFIDAVLYGEYDYDFLKQIPNEEDGEEYAYRVYPLEGYLFPDTYNFYVDSLAETVVDRMLENFDNKLTDKMRRQITDMGWTIDEAVIFASMIQGEGDTRENMDKVSRVLHNRFESDSYKKLQLCSTRDYANAMVAKDHFNSEVLHKAYNTYQREGFPIGPICNIGMDALQAALKPSNDEEIVECYFFATDYKTGTTYFSKTLKEHQKIIKKYGIEDLG